MNPFLPLVNSICLGAGCICAEKASRLHLCKASPLCHAIVAIELVPHRFGTGLESSIGLALLSKCLSIRLEPFGVDFKYISIILTGCSY